MAGTLALLFEALFTDARAGWVASALYSIVGGVTACGGRLVLGALLSARSSFLGALVAVLAFGSLHLVYFANVRLLPGEYYLSPASLGFDALILAGALWALWRLARRLHAPTSQDGLLRPFALLGVVMLLAAPLTLLAARPGPPASVDGRREGPNLLIVLIDSLRRDRLGRPATPSLGDLARRGRSFNSTFAASSWTGDSVAQILGAGDAALPKRLSRHGYVTACFMGNPILSPGAPLLGGFQHVERTLGALRFPLRATVLGKMMERLAPARDEALASKAIAWARRQPGPFLLYVHLMDSHAPYRSHPLDGRRRPGRRIEVPVSGMELTHEEAEDIRARYDAGVHSADAQAGRIVAAVADLGRPFVAVVTSDHGESLGESGRWFHKTGLPPEQLAIPLVLVGEGVVPGEVATPVGHAGIAPTLLAAAGIPCPGCVDLRSQSGSGVVEGGLPPRLAYRIAGRYKVVLDFETGRCELFDWRADPEESRDLAGDHSEIAAKLSAGLTARPHSPTAESIEQLRSLGYAGS